MRRVLHYIFMIGFFAPTARAGGWITFITQPILSKQLLNHKIRFHYDYDRAAASLWQTAEG